MSLSLNTLLFIHHTPRNATLRVGLCQLMDTSHQTVWQHCSTLCSFPSLRWHPTTRPRFTHPYGGTACTFHDCWCCLLYYAIINKKTGRRWWTMVQTCGMATPSGSWFVDMAEDVSLWAGRTEEEGKRKTWHSKDKHGGQQVGVDELAHCLW